MSSVLVIGYGNELRGDDALGPCVVRAIAARFPEVHCLCEQQLLPEFAEELAAAETVIFVDAVNDAAAEVTVQRIDAIGHELRPHHSDPPSLLALTRALYGRVPTAWLVTVSGRSFDIAAELSPRAQRTLVLAIDRVASIVTSCLQRSQDVSCPVQKKWS